MKKSTLLVLALFSSLAVAAPHGKGFHRAELPRGFEYLDLSEAQKAKIKEIVESQPAPAREHKRTDKQQKFAQLMAQERALMDNKQFDEQAARKMIEERRAERLADERAHAERELHMLKKRHAIFQVLTPEQQQKFRQMREKRGGKQPHRAPQR